MIERIFDDSNEELENRFKTYEKLSDTEEVIAGDECGVNAHNGVLCWWNDTWTGYAKDTKKNRKIAREEWDRIMGDIEEDAE